MGAAEMYGTGGVDFSNLFPPNGQHYANLAEIRDMLARQDATGLPPADSDQGNPGP
jgi:hypothetical protein